MHIFRRVQIPSVRYIVGSSMKRAKIQDVARLADVALSTVSAVINGKDIVSEDTKRRVLQAVERLDYQPSLYASNLARHQTRVLGLIVSNLVNPFFAETAHAFEREPEIGSMTALYFIIH